MAQHPVIDTAAVLGTPAVQIVKTDAEEGCMPYNVAWKFLITTNFYSSLVSVPSLLLHQKQELNPRTNHYFEYQEDFSVVVLVIYLPQVDTNYMVGYMY